MENGILKNMDIYGGKDGMYFQLDYNLYTPLHLALFANKQGAIHLVGYLNHADD